MRRHLSPSCVFVSLLAVFLARIEFAASSCSEDDCEACDTEEACDQYGCDSMNDLQGFQCFGHHGGHNNSNGCRQYEIENCQRDCDEEANQGFDFDFEQNDEVRDECMHECTRDCGGGGEGAEPMMLLGVVAFVGIFSSTGSAIIAYGLTQAKLEKEARTYYREKGDKTQGIVVSKNSRYVSSGDSGGRYEYDVTVDVQSEINGQLKRAQKTFNGVDVAMFNSVAQGSLVQVTTIAHLTGDPRNVMLSEYADSDTRGMPSKGCTICFGGIFGGAGVAASLVVSVRLILPENIGMGIAGAVISLIFLFAPIPMAKKHVTGKYEKERTSPSGQLLAPRTDIEMANMRQGGQPIVLQPGTAGQPMPMGVVQQQGGMVVQAQQPGVVMGVQQQSGTIVQAQQPGVVMVQQPVMVQSGVTQVLPQSNFQQQPQVIAQPTAVPVPKA